LTGTTRRRFDKWTRLCFVPGSHAARSLGVMDEGDW